MIEFLGLAQVVDCKRDVAGQFAQQRHLRCIEESDLAGIECQGTDDFAGNHQRQDDEAVQASR